MAIQGNVSFIGATQLKVPLLSGSTFPILFQCPPGVAFLQFKVLGAVGATVWILPTSISGGSVGGATVITNIAGYPLPAQGVDFTPIQGPATCYMTATGSSATVAVNFYYSGSAVTLV